jgi:hypothetical protein
VKGRDLAFRLALAALGSAAVALFAVVLHRHYPLGAWLFWRYAGYWLLTLGALASAGSLGHAALVGLLPRLPLQERLVLSLAIGLLGFGLGWTALGFLRLFNGLTFVVWPLACLGCGALSIWRRRVPYGNALRRISRLRRPLSLFGFGVLAFGVVGLLLAYVPIMTPQNVAFDSRWYHLAMSEHYALEHGIVRFNEGWMLGGYPQLGAYLYAWAFCLPGAGTFDKIELATHFEFGVFLCTLACVPALVRRVLPAGARGTGLSWTVVFLFPELFIYDSNINGGADHIAAFWAVPLFLAFLRARPEFELRRMLLLGALVASIILTKYTACGLLVLPGLAMAARLGRLGVRSFRSKARDFGFLSSALALTGVVLVLTTPLWLKNALWYRDPLFPLLYQSIRPEPWTDESVARLSSLWQASIWRAPRSLEGVGRTLRQLYQFSFVPSDWATFHRDWPMFGSLFTLTVPLALLFRPRRLLALYAAGHLGVLYWFWTFHQDRYLQVYVPWMAAATAATLLLVWRSGWLARVPLVCLVALQAVWGGDAPFFATHAMGNPLRASIDLLGAGFAGKRDERFVAYGDWEQVDKLLPAGSKVLRHENQVHLGIGSPSITDWFQTAISYGRAPEPERVYQVLKARGVTHLLWSTERSLGFDSLAADIAFFNFATRYTRDAHRAGGYTVSRMPETAPAPLGRPLRALYLACSDHSFATGLHDVAALNVMPLPFEPPRPKSDFPAPQVALRPGDDLRPHFAVADAIIHNGACFRGAPHFERFGFSRVARRGDDLVYVRSARP